eukprot:Phypoly_transcript_18941.p1 GENE.Phypoly_transcript_18941~~Phypoly_transcript_18941.p1  ORF type:complete len:117 (+),score=12.14 Phypoly_transcript_18941:136-486(+)
MCHVFETCANISASAPLVQETVRNDKITEVQPVLHREVDKNVVHHIEKHIAEPRAPSMGGVIERNPIVEQQVHTNVVNGKSLPPFSSPMFLLLVIFASHSINFEFLLIYRLQRCNP